MGKIDLRYVKPERDRQGRVAYWYFRRNGRRWRLPGEPLSEEWTEEYNRLKAATDPRAPATSISAIPGSLKATMIAYQRTPDWRNLKPNSQRLYESVIASLIEKAGHLPIAGIERRHVKKWHDERSTTPGMANMLVKVVRLLLTYAVDMGLCRSNPALRIKPFKLGQHRPWTADELMRFESFWAPGTMQRRAYALARYTGQRRGDIAAMTMAHRQGGYIRVVQQKTGTELWIAEHRELAAELARGEQGHISLLVRPGGRAFEGKGLGPWFASAIEASGLPDDCVLHGLRKVAARDLAEAGCSVHEIMAVTGHTSLSEVGRYTRSVNQERLSRAAILKLERNGKRTMAGKRPQKATGKRYPSD